MWRYDLHWNTVAKGKGKEKEEETALQREKSLGWVQREPFVPWLNNLRGK